MLVTLRNTAAVSFEPQEAEVTWRAAIARQFGEARITLPRDAAAYSRAAVNPDGGSLVVITDPAGGTWRGLVRDVSTPADGPAQLVAVHAGALLANLYPAKFGPALAVTAGAVAAHAMGATLDGATGSMLQAGSCVEAAPVLPSFTFGGQSVAQIFGALMDFTGQEWEVDERGRVNWVGRVGREVVDVLCDGGKIVAAARVADPEARVVEVVARAADGREASFVTNEDTGLWAAQELVSDNAATGVALALAARARLVVRRAPRRAYRVDVPRSVLAGGDPVPAGDFGWGKKWGRHWGGGILVAASTTVTSVRDGDTVRLILPWDGPGGRTVVGRVMARTIRANEATVGIEVLALGAGGTSLAPLFLNQSEATLPRPDLDRQLKRYERALALTAAF